MTAFVRKNQKKWHRSFITAAFAASALMFAGAPAIAQGSAPADDVVPAGVAIQTAALSITAPSVAATPTPSSPSPVAALSPSNRTIALALFEAQMDSDDAWSMDRIVVARQSGLGWGRIFRAMKMQGAIAARNLNEVVGAARYSERNRHSRGSYADVRVVRGNGQTILVGQAGIAPRPTRLVAGAATGAVGVPARIDLGRAIVSDFERSTTAGRRYARPISAARVYRD